MKSVSTIAVAVVLLLLVGFLYVPVSAIGAPDGKVVMESSCGECHGVDKVVNTKKDRAGWESTVSRMIAKGAAVNPEEKAALIEYLVNK